MCQAKCDGRETDTGAGQHTLPETAIEIGGIHRLTEILKQSIGSEITIEKIRAEPLNTYKTCSDRMRNLFMPGDILKILMKMTLE